MVSTTSTPIRNTVLSVLLGLLLVSAGCNGLGVGETDTGADDGSAEPTATPVETKTAIATPTLTATPTSEPDPDARDLREIEVQVAGSTDYAPNTLGEIDRGDPTNEDGHYEPVVFAAQANDTVNVTVYANSGDPKVELRAPNGTTLNIDDDGGLGDGAAIEEEILPVTGRYTLLVSPADDSSSETFTYHLTVDRRAYEGELEPEETDTQETGWFAGDGTSWNESERYAEFAYDFAETANNTNAPTNAEPTIWVNPVEDYVVITLIGGPFFNVSQRQDTVAALALTNINKYEMYTDKKNMAINASWMPDRTYVRFVTPEKRGLYRVAFLTTEAAVMGTNRSGGIGDAAGPSIDNYFYTKSMGPAHGDYEEGGRFSTQNRFLLDLADTDPGTELKPPESERHSMNRTTLVNGTLVDVSTLNETGK